MSTSEAERATERLVDSTGPYVTRCGGMDWVGTFDDYSPAYPARSRDEWNTWTREGRFLASERRPHPYDLVAKADVDTLLTACVRNLLKLHDEADPSAERVAFLAAGLVAEYTTRLAEWDDLQEANSSSDDAKVAAVDAKLAEMAGDLITGPGRYPQRDGGVAIVEEHLSVPWGYPWMGRDSSDIGSTWTPQGRLTVSGERPTDIIGPRIPDHLSDEAAAAHARAVAHALRRKEAESLPNDPDPEPAKPEPPKLEEEIGEADADATTCKMRVFAVQAEFDGADADLIMPAIFEALEAAMPQGDEAKQYAPMQRTNVGNSPAGD